MSELIKISGLGDKEIEAVCIKRFGDIAITRTHKNAYWTLTDIPSGFCVPGYFKDHEIAEMAAEEIANTVDWRAMVDALAKGEKPPSAAEVTAILREHGATIKGGGHTGTAAELRRRLPNVR